MAGNRFLNGPGFAALMIAASAAGAAPAHAADAPANPPAPISCASFDDFIATNCPLTWGGVTLYGVIDMGLTWQSHGTPFNNQTPPGEDYFLQKNDNHAQFGLAPNVLSQSAIGLKGNETFAPGWAFVFDLESAFDPYSLRLANGPGAIAENAGVALNAQSSNTDSNKAGQFYNSLGYFGISSPSYGTLTVFRQNTLTLDGVVAYDPLGGSSAFSSIGYQGTTCGVGDTEDCRFTTSLKYRVGVGAFHAAAFWQFGGYEQNNGAKGAYQIEAGGDIADIGGGTLSLDAIYSSVKDAVAISLTGNTLPATLPQIMTATISDNDSVMLLGRYTNGPVKLFTGYERIDYAPPSDPQTAFTDIAGDPLCLSCAAIDNTNINNSAYSSHDKLLQVFWAGARYAVAANIDVMAGYYQYRQSNYGTGVPCTDSSKGTCSGAYDAVSLAADWQFAAKFDCYAGLMYQTVSAGLANGYLYRNTIDPAAGVRLRF